MIHREERVVQAAHMTNKMENTDQASDLTARPAVKRTTWDLLNSPFILFLFSSLVIGGVSFGYNEYASYRKKTDDKETQISKLISEARYRIDTISSIVQDQFTFTALFSANGAILGDMGNRNSDNRLIGNYSPIYQDFINRNLISLLWELRDIYPDRKIKAELHKGIDAVGRLRLLWDNRIEMLKGVEPGSSDSIWHFKTLADAQEFDKNIKVVREALKHLPDTPRD